MTDVLAKNSFRLSYRKAHGRIENVIADLLRRQLYVPHIFLNPKISRVPPVDVLAVDRAGSGDFHAVEIKILTILPTRSQLRTLIKPVKALPFHYKYIALPGFSKDLSDAKRFQDYPELFDESGIGRIGIVSFDHMVLNQSKAIDTNSACVTVLPERFRVGSENLATIERFLDKSRPDMEVRI